MKPDDVAHGFVVAGFCGFFTALALASGIVALVMRSWASAAYTLLTAVMASALLAAFPGRDGGPYVHSLLQVAYDAGLVVFALTLLQTMRYDKSIGQAAIVVVAVNIPLIFAENLLPFWAAKLSIVDRLCDLALLGVLIAMGVRAVAHEGRAANAYLAAMAGPAVAAIAGALASFGVLPFTSWGLTWVELGMVWLSMLFAVGVASSNTTAQGERDRFERLAYLDGLTGVANRRTFDETLERMWNVARRAGVPVAIAMIDIDHFKRLNDTRGHQVGDECLRRVAALCSSVLRRAGDCFARYGGEEFAAILVNVDLDHAVTLAHTMRRAVEADGGITVSIGLAARVPTSTETQHELIADADHALYRAKHEGRNCVRVAGLEKSEAFQA